MHLISFILRVINYLNHLSSNMESTWLVLLFSCIAALAYLSKLFFIKRRSQWNPPPGPKPWPIIGNLHQVGSIPHQSLHKLAQKYGEIMLLKLGSRPLVVASSPEMAKQILRTHDTIFASRPKIAAGKYTSYNNVNMVWAPYGPYWRLARKIFVGELFNSKRLDAFQYIRVEERKALISRLFALSGKPITLKEHLLRYTLSSIGRMVLSDKYFSKKLSNNSIVSLEALHNMLVEWSYVNGVVNLGDWIPWLGFLDLQGYVKQMKNLNKRLDRFHNIVLADHKAKTKANNSEDLVDVLLQQEEDPNLEIKLTTDCIKGLVQDLLAGGTDTSATTVEWAFNELLKHPQVLEKATEELDRVIGKERWVEEKDFNKLPYIDGILKETFRLHPVGTLLAPHYSTQDCNVAGYDIAKGTIVWVNIWSIGRDPKNWESPEEFNPQRFMEKEIDISGQNFNLLPFGSGRRSCPGYNLGTKIVRSSLANLIHGFNWKLPENMKPEDVSMEERFGLATHPKFPLPVIMKPRLPSHLYY